MIQPPHSTISLAANSRWLVITRPLPPGSPLPLSAEQRMEALATSEATSGIDIDGTRPRTRRKRKPSITTLVKRAEKAGKAVTSITTTADGTTLTFGDGESTADNEVENWFSKQRRHADQR
jgi:hypothetical protein